MCHTQYNLTLASGTSTSMDDRILFIDFNLTDGLREKLEAHFNNCPFFDGNYPKKELLPKEKLDKITRDIRKIGVIIINWY